MGSHERRERERLEQRQRILTAALNIISEEGFAALSMRKIADRIEYSVGTIYLYFRSREEIARELSDAGYQKLLDKVTERTHGITGVEALHAMGIAYIDYALENPEIYRLIFMGDTQYMLAAYSGMSPDCAAARSYRQLMDLAGQLKEVGGTDADVATVADLIWSCLHGIVSLHLTCPKRVTPPREMVAFATEAIARGLCGTTLPPARSPQEALPDPRNS